MTQTLGQKGCLNANLELAQSQALSFEIIHEDEQGNPIDHSGDTGHCRLQRKDHEDVILDSCIDLSDAVEGIVRVNIPGTLTSSIDTGTWVWDLFIGECRLVYGTATVFDTYAMDGA